MYEYIKYIYQFFYIYFRKKRGGSSHSYRKYNDNDMAVLYLRKVLRPPLSEEGFGVEST